MKYVNILTLICVSVTNFYVSQSAKILGVFQFPSKSHQTVYKTLMKELSLRGHQVVTIVSTNPLNDSLLVNLTEIQVTYPKTDNKRDYYSLTYQNFIRAAYDDLYGPRADFFFEHDKVKTLCVNETFDLVIVEAYVPIWYAYGRKCNAHATIGISSMEQLLNGHTSKGNPTHPALYGDFILQHWDTPDLWRKIKYSYYFLWYHCYNKFHLQRISDNLIRKYFGEDYPSTEELEKNSSLLFTNTNYLLMNLRPLGPSTIPLGFMHIRPVVPLPKDLQTILDQAKNGVVYFSLGSNVKSSKLPHSTVEVIKGALSELPYTVLWKWETDDVPEVGKNVVTRKWFPQQDILAHPNVKVFVTQGGLQSTEEAIFYGVPMVGIPFFCDQEMNVRKSEKLGASIYLEKTSLTKEAIKNAVLEIMLNSSYQKNIEELQKIAKDQPMTGLERAVWWTEYVIRHKGARHLRSPAADISLFEYLLLDVILVVLSALIVVVFVTYKIVRLLFRMVRGQRRKVKKS